MSINFLHCFWLLQKKLFNRITTKRQGGHEYVWLELDTIEALVGLQQNYEPAGSDTDSKQGQ